MTEFEVWYKNQPISERSCQEAFKAGMLIAAEIADDVDAAGEDAYSIREQIVQTIKNKAEAK